MSDYQGNIIIKNPAAPAGPFETGAAPGVWKLSEVLPFVRQGIWPTPGIAGPDPYFPYVSLLLSTTSLNNANNNLFVDSSGAFNPISRFGNTTQGSFTPYATNWSNFFDGSGDYLTVSSNAAFGMGTGDFTIECWVNPTAFTGSGNVLVDMRSGTEPSVRPDLEYNSSGVLNYRVNGSTVISGGTLVIGTWSHVALARSGTTTKLFLNGVQVGSSYTDSNNYGSSAACRIGADDDGSPNAYVNGYMSNVRVVKGTAVYTSNFTVPTTQLTAISGTSLLTCQSNRFIDNSSNAFTITVNGNTSVTDFGPFSPAYPGAVYNQSDITNWSGYFDGSGDYGRITGSQTSLQFGTGDFTLEGWVYSTGATGTYQQILTGGSSWTSGSGGVYWYYNGGSPYIGAAWNQIATNPAVNSGTLATNTWHHFAVVRSGNTLSLYVNGTSVDTLDVTGVSMAVNNQSQTNIGGGGWDQDFGGYLSNLRVVKGTAVYTGNFTPPTTNLTAISGTSLLTLQNAAFTDNSTNNFVITPNGNVTVTGNSPFNTVGYWSNYFDGTSDSLTYTGGSSLNFGTSDFTIELWAFLTNTGTFSPFIRPDDSGSFPEFGYDFSAGQLKFDARNAPIVAVTTTMPTNQWVHVAASRSGTSLRLFVNGTQVGSTTTNSTNFGSTTGTIRIGGSSFSTSHTVNGYLSNFRVIKGTALYTANFTPPTTPLTAITNTSLLTCQNGRFIDNSTNAFTITANGNTSIQSFDPFYTSTIASNGGSMYFDGSGDYLTTTNYNLSGDATVECWLYVNSLANPFQIFGTNNGVSDGRWIGALVATNGALAGGAAAGISSGYSSASGTIKIGQWQHIAWVKTASGVFVYVNGTQVATCSLAQGYAYNATPLYIGRLDGNNAYCPNGYISNLRIVNGSAIYTSSFTPPTAPANPTPATVLMVNGMNAGIYDATAINDMETVGNAQVRYFIGNYYAGSFDGTGDYLSTATSGAIALGTSDFTFECWVNPTAYPNDATLVYAGSTSTGNEISLQIRNGQVASHLYISGSHSDVQFTDLPVSLNTWSHLAISRVSGVLYGFLNGVRSSVTTALTTNFGSSAAAYVAVGDRFAGSLSNARITKNSAIYSTATYTVPTSPLTPTSNTAFLTCQNTTFIDNSPNALAITVNGGATAGASGPFTYTRGNSVFLDATDDCLTFPASPNLALGSAAFTIEAWVYLTTLAGTKPIIECRTSGGSASGYALLVNSTGNLNVYTSGAFLGASSTALSANTWNHVALVRSGTGSNQTTYYINGVASGTITMSGNFTDATSTVTRVGASTTAGELWPGYIDDLRVTRGVARYTSNFTPSNKPFPPY